MAATAGSAGGTGDDDDAGAAAAGAEAAVTDVAAAVVLVVRGTVAGTALEAPLGCGLAVGMANVVGICAAADNARPFAHTPARSPQPLVRGLPQKIEIHTRIPHARHRAMRRRPSDSWSAAIARGPSGPGSASRRGTCRHPPPRVAVPILRGETAHQSNAVRTNRRQGASVHQTSAGWM